MSQLLRKAPGGADRAYEQRQAVEVRRAREDRPRWRSVLDRRRAIRRRGARVAAALESSAEDLRRLDERPVLRRVHQRADRGGLWRHGRVSAAHVPGADEALAADARVVRVASLIIGGLVLDAAAWNRCRPEHRASAAGRRIRVPRREVETGT